MKVAWNIIDQIQISSLCITCVGTKKVDWVKYIFVISCPPDVWYKGVNINYNAEKSNIQISRSTGEQSLVFSDFLLSGSVLKICTVVKSWGHYISGDLWDMSQYGER